LSVIGTAIISEFEELQQHLQEYQVLQYKPPQIVKQTYKDGGVAIIEQIICSHARYCVFDILYQRMCVALDA
jgi:peptide-O-fucosyltransferase